MSTGKRKKTNQDILPAELIQTDDFLKKKGVEKLEASVKMISLRVLAREFTGDTELRSDWPLSVKTMRSLSESKNFFFDNMSQLFLDPLVHMVAKQHYNCVMQYEEPTMRNMRKAFTTGTCFTQWEPILRLCGGLITRIIDKTNAIDEWPPDEINNMVHEVLCLADVRILGK